jgi:hypothetical protein
MDYVPTRQDAATAAFGRPVRRRRGGTAVESAIFDAVIVDVYSQTGVLRSLA